MSRIYVFSTLAASQAYSLGDSGLTKVINGQANVANKHLLTPRGVATEVSEEELHALRQDRVFDAHLKNGFLAVSHSKTERDADDMAKDMNGQDPSQQATPELLAEKAKAEANKPGPKRAAPAAKK